jgi:ATP-dependent helicase HepA
MLRMFPRGTVRATFARWTALRHEDARLLRLGEPFYEAVQEFSAWDDRGRTFACWRYRPEYRGRDPEWAFRFDYVIEADPGPAAALLLKQGVHGTEQSLRRQLDAFLPPVLRTLWLDSGNRIVSDESRLKALDAPYERAAGDVNLRPARFAAADRLFGGVNWEAMCRAARDASQVFVVREQGRRLEEAYLKAERVMSGRLEILRARSERAGGIAAEIEEADREAEIVAALLQGIRTPVTRLEAVGFIVLAPTPLEVGNEDV